MGEGRREAERQSRVGSVKPLVLLSKHTLTFPHRDHRLCVSSETTNRTLQPLLPPSSALHTRDHQGTAPAAVSQHRPGLCCLQVAMWGTTSARRWRRTSHQWKARRLKQAKEEAQMEVEQYRREREQEFQSKQQAAMGSQGNLSAEVEQATRRQVQGMQSSQQRNRERVLAQLLGMVCDVRPQVHPNYRITV
nr:V-type proton ATPase subunit G 2 isoform X1 [Myodes glareolus]